MIDILPIKAEGKGRRWLGDVLEAYQGELDNQTFMEGVALSRAENVPLYVEEGSLSGLVEEEETFVSFLPPDMDGERKMEWGCSCTCGSDLPCRHVYALLEAGALLVEEDPGISDLLSGGKVEETPPLYSVL